MSGELHDTLVDELEQDLRQALNVEPSPDFVRRVRAQIEQRSARRLTSVVRWQTAVAAVVSVAALGTAWMMTREPLELRVTPLTRLSGGDVALEAEQPTSNAVSTQRSRTPRREPPVRLAKAAEPEIIVPPDRAEGLARFLELARTRAVTEETLRPVAAATPNVALDIKPLLVPPISVPEIDVQGGAAPDGADRE